MMMKKIIVVCCVLLLSGCTAVIDWGKKSFKQAESLETNRDTVAQYIRTETVYDQFDTQARFVGLWLNDEVRTEYARLHGRCRGSSSEQDEILIQRQLAENKNFITFYVLSLAEIPLGEPESVWHLFLKINDTTIIVPTDIKMVELPNEYKFFFGKHYTRFKTAYRILFDAKDLEDRCFIDTTTQHISLIIRSVYKEVTLHWKTTSTLLHCTKVEEAPEKSPDAVQINTPSSLVPEAP